MVISSPPALNLTAPGMLNLLLSRRSAKAAAMSAPGPSPEEMEIILNAAARTPDHGKLFPWRFILFEGESRTRFGKMLVEILKARETLSPERETQEMGRFLRAPIVVGVVSRARSGLAVPEWEQILSAGAACQNLLLAAHALGYVGAWLTEWFAYDPPVLARIGLGPTERIAGFVYLGKSSVPLVERPRPDPAELTTRY
jgi:nitroreductase